MAHKKPWDERECMRRARRLAERELRNCPEGYAPVIGHIFRAIAHEILTPLPNDVLNIQGEAVAAYEDLTNPGPLTDRTTLIGWIRSNGGMKPTKDHPELLEVRDRVAFLNKKGCEYDELVQMLADLTGKRFRDVERLMIRTLCTSNSVERSGKSRRQAIKAIEKLLDVFNGRALKTNYVPAYYAGPPLDPEIAAEMRRLARDIAFAAAASQARSTHD